MKYLVGVDWAFQDNPGGAPRVAWDIAECLRDRGHEVAFICMEGDPAARDSSIREDAGFRIVRYVTPPAGRLNPFRGRRHIDACAAAFHRFLGHENWDIAHIHTTFTGAGLIKALAGRTRIVSTVHSPVVMEQEINWRYQGLPGKLKLLLGRGPLRRLEGEQLLASVAIHALSRFTQRHMQREHGLGERVQVIPHWRRPQFERTVSREDARRRLGWPTDRPVIYTLRRHVERMGLDVAIRAVAPLCATHRFTFVVAGDGPLRPQLTALARSLGAGEESMPFPGRVSDEHLLLGYQAADLFLLPTVELECFGLITLEALSFGCPVIGTDAGATPELLDPLAPGLVVAAGDVAALQKKVRAFLDGTLPLPDSARIAEYVDGNYSERVIVPRFLELFERALAAPLPR